MKLTDYKVDKKAVKKSAKRIAGNEIIADFYRQLYTETAREKHLNRAESVCGCFQLWDIDHYRKQGIKDIKRINLCKDKFCLNCQNVQSKRRYTKYKPVLDDLMTERDIYHIVFTVPNCDGEELLGTLDRMYTKFPYIVRYFGGERKCNGLDFRSYGYIGAVRGLEITTKATKGKQVEYHPHFYCLFVLHKKGVNGKRKHINDFSYHNGKLRRKFTDFEILLQKTWYLFYNDQRLTADVVNSLQQGYSVTVDRANGNYKEVFKYAVKGSFKDGAIFNYDVFETLYYALHRRKVLQGYGVLNKYDFETVAEAEVEKVYAEILAELRKIEDPEKQLLKLQEICAELEHDDITYISKNAIRRELLHNDA